VKVAEVADQQAAWQAGRWQNQELIMSNPRGHHPPDNATPSAPDTRDAGGRLPSIYCGRALRRAFVLLKVRQRRAATPA
jgi:hypothetical protein